MKLVKYILSFSALIVGFAMETLRGVYQNLVLSLLCDTMYKIGPNPICDQLMNLPDFGLLFLILGIFGLLASAYMDLEANNSEGYR